MKSFNLKFKSYINMIQQNTITEDTEILIRNDYSMICYGWLADCILLQQGLHKDMPRKNTTINDTTQFLI